MNKKIFNRQRRRLITFIIAMYAATYAAWAALYFNAPEAKRTNMLFVIIFTSCLGLVGVGGIIALFYRFPVQNDDEIDSK